MFIHTAGLYTRLRQRGAVRSCSTEYTQYTSMRLQYIRGKEYIYMECRLYLPQDFKQGFAKLQYIYDKSESKKSQKL